MESDWNFSRPDYGQPYNCNTYGDAKGFLTALQSENPPNYGLQKQDRDKNYSMICQ